MAPPSPISWNPALSVGVPAIDAQHQELFARAAQVEQAIGAGASSARLEKLLAWLQSYALAHFDAEERIMRQAGYPDLPRHLAEHSAFRRRVELLLRLHEAEGDSVPMAQLVLSFVRDWLVEHIGTSDRAVGEHVRGQGGASPTPA